MVLEQLNEWGACSSLMLRNLHDVKFLSEADATAILCALWSRKLCQTETMASGVYPCHCSFVCVSLTPDMGKAGAFLEDFGFVFTEPVFNMKNGTKPFFGVASVPAFQENLKKLYEKHKEAVDRQVGEKQVEVLRQIFEGKGPALPVDDDLEDYDEDYDDDWYAD